MDFGLTDAQLALREEVRDLLRGTEVGAQLRRIATALPHTEPGTEPGTEPDASAVYRALGERRLLAVDWPARFGGRDLSKVDAMLVAEELAAAGVPDTQHVNSVQIVGNFLLEVATEAQNLRWLPDLAAGRAFAAVLFSEPGTGSDLSGLTTTAARTATGYHITGRKRYVLKARSARHLLCAARTDPDAGRYRGLSLFLIPAASAGLTVRTLPTVADEQFHEVELAGVEVGAGDRVGAEGAGWSLINRMMVLERTGVDYHAKGRGWFERLLRAVAERPDRPDGGLLERIGRHGATLTGSQLLSRAVVSGLAAGEPDETLAAMAKWHASEAAAAVAELATEELAAEEFGADELGGEGLVWVDAAYREAPGLTLSAGSSEMMLALIAGSRLGAAAPARGREDLVISEERAESGARKAAATDGA